MASHPQKKNVSMRQVLTALLDDQNPFPPAYLQHFSDLEGKELSALHSVWPQVSTIRRVSLLEDLEEINDSDTLVDFNAIARLALTDPDPRARTLAIRLLWEEEDPRLAQPLIKMMNEDPDANVRAAAASGLGKLIYLGELEEIPEDVLHQVEAALLNTTSGSDEVLVRRRALEALGFSGRKEVPALIRKAYESNDTDWLSSALYAMGRSADQTWEPDVKRMLRNPKANVQLEAVRAAGELSLESTRRILLDLLEEEGQDSDTRAAIIWSLSQVGGEEVRDTLEGLMEETDDDEELEILENALDNLTFIEDVGTFGLFNFDQLGQPNEEIEDIEAYLTSLEEDDTEWTESPKGDLPGGESSDITKSSKDQSRHRHKKSPKDE